MIFVLPDNPQLALFIQGYLVMFLDWCVRSGIQIPGNVGLVLQLPMLGIDGHSPWSEHIATAHAVANAVMDAGAEMMRDKNMTILFGIYDGRGWRVEWEEPVPTEVRQPEKV